MREGGEGGREGNASLVSVKKRVGGLGCRGRREGEGTGGEKGGGGMFLRGKESGAMRRGRERCGEGGREVEKGREQGATHFGMLE